MGEAFDLAKVAGMAGLGGSAIAGIVGAMVFKGLILRILTQIVLTTVLTVVGFVALLGMLGFEIVPKPETASRATIMADGLVTTQSVPASPSSEETVPPGKKRLYVKSPWKS